MANITYLLGAGASAEALPVVSGLQDRLVEFRDLLYKKLVLENDFQNGFNHSSDWAPIPFEEDSSIQLPSLLNALNTVIEENQKHYSIDTYAKKLYLSKSNEDYINLKAVLVCFFLYAQMQKDEALYMQEEKQSESTFTIKINEEKEGYRKSLKERELKYIDKRYDAFFAALLKPNQKGGLELPADINIISWNYDAQFELSYVGFINPKYRTSYSDYNKITKRLKILSTNQLSPKKSTNSKLIKLNGSTDYITNTSGTRRSHIYYQQQLTDTAVFDQIFEEVKSLNGDFFNFAWESNIENDIRIDTAKKIIAETNVLVIIGYTFPYYNMDVDKAIFGNKHFSKVYVQDLPDQHETLIDRLQYFGINKNVIKAVKQTDLFFIPPEYIGTTAPIAKKKEPIFLI